jgi:hypothetical protein
VAEYSRLRPKPSLSSVPTSQSQEPCFLPRAILRELRHMIFQTMAYKERTIYVDQYACDKGLFHSLLKTFKKLREGISEWVSKRSDIVDSPVFGLSCTSATTFRVAFSENLRTTFGEVRTYNAPQSRRQLFRLGCWKYLMDQIKSTTR